MTKQNSLYEILGVPPAATAAEITRAYRLQALKCHPDRNPTGGEMFKKLGEAYAVLSDEGKRQIYDVTGKYGEGDVASVPTGNGISPDEIADEVAKFYQTYTGSAEEQADVAEAFVKCKGNFAKMMEGYVIFENTEGSVQRLFDLVKKVVDEGVVASTPAWEGVKPSVVRKLEKQFDAERVLAEKMHARMKKEGGGSSPAAGLGALFDPKQREKDYNNMCDKLMDKYVTKGKKKKKQHGAGEETAMKKKKKEKQSFRGGEEEEGAAATRPSKKQRRA